jgi:NAD(P)-dependent dehydrogenase (short-subunit alcohol dehydrogenase family)
VDEALAAATRDAGLDLAVNAAGVTGPLTPCADLAVADWQRIVGVNLTGTFLCMRAQIAAMLRTGGGAIVNMSSIMGSHAMPGTAAYAASKHAVEGLTKAAALDYAKRGIRINAVAPGYVDTPMIAGRSSAVQDKIAAMHPIGRIAEPGEIAKVIAFLLSADASFVTGSVHLADGGFSAQ